MWGSGGKETDNNSRLDRRNPPRLTPVTGNSPARGASGGWDSPRQPVEGRIDGHLKTDRYLGDLGSRVFMFPNTPEKWSAGFANVLFDGRSRRFQYGYLLTWQASFVGSDDRADVTLGALQPFAFYTDRLEPLPACRPDPGLQFRERCLQRPARAWHRAGDQARRDRVQRLRRAPGVRLLPRPGAAGLADLRWIQYAVS